MTGTTMSATTQTAVLIGCEAVIEAPGDDPVVGVDLFPDAASAWAWLAAWRDDELDSPDATSIRMRALRDPGTVVTPEAAWSVRDLVADVPW